MPIKIIVLVSLFGLLASHADAGGIGVGWRGDGMGRYPDAEPSLEWAKDKNVLWVTPTENWSYATPAVGEQRIFITAESTTLICLNKGDGKLLWQFDHEYKDLPPGDQKTRLVEAEKLHQRIGALKGQLKALRRELGELEESETKDDAKIAELKLKIEKLEPPLAELEAQYKTMAEFHKPETSPNCGYASATPVTDGQRVWVVFGNSVAACYDEDGGRRWIRIIDKPGKQGFGHSSSPLLVDDKFVIQMDDLVAYDAQTCKELWRVAVDVMPGTPVQTRLGGESVIVAPSGHIVRARDGALLAHVKTSSIVFNSPIVHDGVVYIGSNMKGDAVAVKLPDKAEPFEPEFLWTTTVVEGKHYYASPVYHEGLLFTLAEFDGLSAIDAKSGELLYTRKLEISTAFPSITVAGDHVMVAGQGGKTYVLEPKRQFTEVARNELEFHRSSPVFDGTRMYVRARENVYCIGR